MTTPVRLLPLLALLALAPDAPAAGPAGRGGLAAAAVSPDGKRLAAGGQNRVIYLLDPDTLAVQKRIWLGARVGRLAFTADGKRLLVEDDADTLHLIDPDTGKTLARRAEVAGLTLAPGGGLLAVRDTAELNANRLFFLSPADLKEQGRCQLPHRPVAWAFEPDGKRLLALESSRETDEKRAPPGAAPTTLTGLARQAYRQKNDGVGSALQLIDAPAGKVARTTPLWYTSDSDSTLLIPAGDDTLILNRGNVCARVGPKEVTLFETAQTVNLALAASPDGKLLWTGGLARGTVGPPGGDKPATFELSPLPGQGELVAAFATRGTEAWVVTSAFRVARLTREGKVVKVAPVY